MSYLSMRLIALGTALRIDFLIMILSGIFFSVHASADNSGGSWEEGHLHLVKNYILPHYDALSIRSTQLKKSISIYCEDIQTNKHKQHQLALIKKTFKELYIDWAAVQPINFGPITYLKRQVRMQYWPDKHNVGGKQLRQLLLNQNTITLEALQKKSVAIQGLPALERLLFSTKSLTQENCGLAYRISENIKSIAQETVDGWTQSPALFMNDFSSKNYHYGTYSSASEITSVIAKSITHSLALIEQEKLKATIKNDNKKSNPRKLEAWRSGISSKLIHANLTTVENMYLSVFSNQLIPKNSELDKRIRNEITFIKLSTSALETTLREALTSNKNEIEFITWKGEIKNLQRLIHQAFHKELGLTFSFNSLDGD
jgi:predicted lipoprotein